MLKCGVCNMQNGKGLLIVSDKMNHGIYVYDTNKDELVWSVKGKLTSMVNEMDAGGVTTDGFGRVFVCDRANRCIQVLSIVDGSYLGCLLKAGEQGLGDPLFIRWCNDTSSLIVCCGIENERFVSVINVHK